jgi:UDP:flavonoid glycosyltransferase YjiC (YdhE family)
MRVLMVTWGWRSHFYPMTPLAWALLAAGHELRVAGQPGQVEAVTGAGLPAVPVGPDLDFATVFGGRVGPVRSRQTSGPVGEAAPRNGLDPAVTADGGVVRYADAMLDELVAFGRHYRPDLVVYEPFNLAGSLLAAVLGVPDVRLLWGPDSSTELALDEELVIGPRAARLGVDRVRLTGTLTLDPCPPPMQVLVTGPSQPMRFVPYNGTAVVPDWLRRPADRPRVCVTWGTMMAELGLAEMVGAPRVLEALAGLDIEVVVAMDVSQHHTLGPLPANVRLAAAPLALHLVLPTCQALVHQGGAGTMMTGLACGVPQLILPQVSDQHFNAARLAVTGAGGYLAGPQATPEAIRARVLELLTDPAWSSGAGQLRQANAGRPSPAQLVPVRHRLAGAGRPEPAAPSPAPPGARGSAG